ncbi:hypothetical protein RN001_008924 [Aquatica leii]|uniref:Uncharacterized protein n=1 Tax=Aquatica leii TaxID=1421715 RepID=A0AAN7PB93_9COLE|nr:hypothetical protein RN001_008924 [Aquatica leii]
MVKDQANYKENQNNTIRKTRATNHKKEAEDQPYNVTYLTFQFFKSFSSLAYYSLIRPGFKKGDPQVTDIRCLRYNPSGFIEFKLIYNKDCKILPKRRKDEVFNKNVSASNIPCLYKENLKIEKKSLIICRY